MGIERRAQELQSTMNRDHLMVRVVGSGKQEAGSSPVHSLP